MEVLQKWVVDILNQLRMRNNFNKLRGLASAAIPWRSFLEVNGMNEEYKASKKTNILLETLLRLYMKL
jgi:hypothetical protein